MTLNAPRTIPYEFRVVEIDGFVWLFDNSARTFCCSATPSMWLEPLYSTDGSDDHYPDPAYFTQHDIEKLESLLVYDEGAGPEADENENDAWAEARNTATTNHLI